MRMLEFIVPKEYDGAKAYGFLRGFCKLSYRLLVSQKHVEGGITANGCLLRTIDRVRAGDVVRVTIPADQRTVQAHTLPISIVYEDEDIFVLNKPSNMPVHPSRGHERDTLANACAAYLARKGHRETFRPLNRLDRDTTGLLVAARNPYAAARLVHAIQKEYTAVCEGILSGSGSILSPIRIKAGHGIQREAGEDGQPSATHWTALSTNKAHTMLYLKLDTGRTHQIRVHMSSIGHPLAGDGMYGGSTAHIGRQALHCARLRFIHPVTQRDILLTAPLPEDMRSLAERLGLLPGQKSMEIPKKGEDQHAGLDHPLPSCQ